MIEIVAEVAPPRLTDSHLKVHPELLLEELLEEELELLLEELELLEEELGSVDIHLSHK